MIDTKNFIEELKRFGVIWNEKEKVHLIGKEILTNKDMRIMCSNRFGKEYDNLNSKEQKKLRQSIFRSIRYD